MKEKNAIDLYQSLRMELHALYRGLAVQYGITESEMWVLYTVMYQEGDVTQHTLCQTLFCAKQTVHTAVQHLIQRDILVLQPMERTKKQKKVCITEKGLRFAEKTVAKLREAEEKVLCHTLSDSIMQYILTKREIIDQLYGELKK